MTKQEYLEESIRITGLPRAIVEQGLDLAEASFRRALASATELIELHHDSRVQAYATIELCVMMKSHYQAREGDLTLLAAVLKAEARHG